VFFGLDVGGAADRTDLEEVDSVAKLLFVMLPAIVGLRRYPELRDGHRPTLRALMFSPPSVFSPFVLALQIGRIRR
jgi:hypothetical protein